MRKRKKPIQKKEDAFCGSGNVRPSEREFKSLQKKNWHKRKLEILKNKPDLKKK